MDEPLLGQSFCGQKYSRKGDIPILSLVCDSPRRRLSPWASNPSSPRSYQSPSTVQPHSPRSYQSPGTFQTHPPYSFEAYSPCSLQSHEQGSSRIPEFYAGSAPSPRFAPSPRSSPRFAPLEQPSWNSSVWGAEFNGVGTLHRIPEELPQSIGEQPPSSPKLAAQGDEPDLEASSSAEERNYSDGNDDNTGVFGEPLSVDGEQENGEKQSWAAELTGFIISALPSLPSIPDVLQALSSSPEHNFLRCPGCENDSDDPKDHDHDHDEDTHKRCSSCPSLASHLREPDLSTEQLLDQTAAVSPSKGDSVAPDLLDPDLKASVERRRRKSIHRCRTAPVLTGLLHTKVEHSNRSTKAPKQGVSSVVWQASMGLCVYLTAGVIIYIWKKDEFSGIETVAVIDAIYFCIVTMCTIGYGDITPVTPLAKLLACALMFVGFGFIDFLLTGMVTFVLDRQEHLLLDVVKDGHHERAKNYVMDSKKGRMRIRMKVALAVCTVLTTIVVGVLFLRYMEGLTWIDALYVTCISITTVGYGDFSFQTVWGRLFAAVWLLLSTLGVARAFLFLAEARVHKRHRHFAKRVLEQKMTTDDLMTMDLDNDGHVSKSEFVVYKLKAMGKINEGDVMEICKQFDVIDNLDVGKITLAQLQDADS